MSDATSPDPYREWIANHRALLKEYPDSFVAISLERGIVFSTRDESQFIQMLKDLPDEERVELLTIHTSTYV